ncbi:MAG: endonuclease/exonuclease/phosphatase family protein [Steroidobacteraceae bacterium]
MAAELGRYRWFLDLFAHFKLQYAVAFAFCFVTGVGLRQRALAALALGGAVFHAWPVLALAYPHHDRPEANFRLVSFNAGFWNDHYAEIGAFLESTRADAVILLEYRNDQLDQLARFLPSYRFRLSEQADLRYGAAILSRWPLSEGENVALSPGGAVVARARIHAGQHTVSVSGVHLSWPATPRSARSREQELVKLGHVLASCNPACVVAGDFNLTQWSGHFADFQEHLGWHNCASGQGIVRSWPNLIWPLGIQIDQCLTSPRVRIARFATGPAMGSDHFPIVIDLAPEPY